MPFDPTKYGAKLLKTTPVQGGASSGFQPAQEQMAQQQSQAPQQQGPGFVQSVAQGLAKPFLKLYSSGKEVRQQGYGIAQDVLGDKTGSAQTQQDIEKAKKEGYDYGYLGKVTPLGATGSAVGDLKESVGTGAEIASYLIPEAKFVKNPILRGLTTGATVGGTTGAANALEAGGNVGDVVKGGLTGAAVGAATGGVLGGAAPAVKSAVEAGGKIGKFLTSNVTGLSRDTIETIIHNPEKITPQTMEVLNREYLGNKVSTAVKQRLDDLASTGKEYQVIRESRTPVTVPKDLFPTVLKKYGLNLDETGKISTSIDSVPLSSGDLDALQGFYDQYGKHSDLTSNSFLNVRKALDNLSSFGKDPNKTDISDVIGRDLRSMYDEVGKTQIPALRSLDSKFAPERKLLGQIRKDYLNPDGTLKDNALNKIANLGNKGKSQVLQRLEKISPGIEQDINILRAVEDIKDSSGIKIGTYARGGLAGLVLGGGNPMAAVVGIVLSSPSTAVPILRAFGKSRKISAPLIENIISRMKGGKVLSEPMKRVVENAFVDLATDKKNKTAAQAPGQNTDAYLKSLGI